MNPLNQIFGIGIDAVDIAVFKNLIKNDNSAWKKYFKLSELNYCKRKSHPEQHLAGKFAAKEAVIKAISKYKKVKFSDIEIKHLNNEPIAIIIHDNNINNKFKILISITHTKDTAAAVAVVTVT